MLLRRNPNFRLFFASAGISNLGDGISAVAFPWLATLLTRDPVMIGMVAAAQRLPWLIFSLPAGVVTDRVNRQRLMVLADAMRMGLTLVVVALILSAPPLPLTSGGENLIWALAGLAFLLGVAEVFRDNTAQTSLPQIVDKKDLETANGQLWSVEQIMGQFIGPPIAGFIIAVSVPLPFIVDAATFGIAAFLVYRLSMQPSARAPHSGGFAEQFVEGARWMAGHRTILSFAIMLSVLNFVTFGSQAILVLFAQDVLGLAATGFGILLSISALGAAAGGLIGPRIAKALGPKPTLILSLGMFVVGFVGIAISDTLAMTGASFALMWFFGMVWNVVTVSFRQRVIPPELLGRVNSIYRFFGWGSIPLGALFMGALVSWVEPTWGREMALRLPYVTAAVATTGLLLFAVLFLQIKE